MKIGIFLLFGALIAGVPDFEEFCSSCHVVEEHSAEAKDTDACDSCHTDKSYTDCP